MSDVNAGTVNGPASDIEISDLEPVAPISGRSGREVDRGTSRVRVKRGYATEAQLTANEQEVEAFEEVYESGKKADGENVPLHQVDRLA